MLCCLCIIKDLVDVVHIGVFYKGDMRPPFTEVGGDLDELVLRLSVGFAVVILLADLLVEEALVAVCLDVDRCAEEAVGFGENLREDLIHVLPPETAVEEDPVVNPLRTGESGVILAAVGCINMGDAITEEGRIGAGRRRGLEEGLA